jgi:hypothetical protein
MALIFIRYFGILLTKKSFLNTALDFTVILDVRFSTVT